MMYMVYCFKPCRQADSSSSPDKMRLKHCIGIPAYPSNYNNVCFDNQRDNLLTKDDTMQEAFPTCKLIAIDIDGTLLTPAGQITPRTRAAIQQAQRMGIIVTLATARRYFNTMAIAAELGLELPLIVYDGGLIVSHPSRAILAGQALPAHVAQQAVEICAAPCTANRPSLRMHLRGGLDRTV